MWMVRVGLGAEITIALDQRHVPLALGTAGVVRVMFAVMDSAIPVIIALKIVVLACVEIKCATQLNPAVLVLVIVVSV